MKTCNEQINCYILQLDLFLQIVNENEIQSGFQSFVSQVGYAIGLVLKGFLTSFGLFMITSWNVFGFWIQLEAVCPKSLFVLCIIFSNIDLIAGTDMYFIGMVQCCITYMIIEKYEAIRAL